jgi:hypothetical protein
MGQWGGQSWESVGLQRGTDLLDLLEVSIETGTKGREGHGANATEFRRLEEHVGFDRSRGEHVHTGGLAVRGACCSQGASRAT